MQAYTMGIPLLERTLDVDGHEFAPPQLWRELFAPLGNDVLERCFAANGEWLLPA